MTPADLQNELFSQLAEPFTGEALFDCLPDVVFFIKNHRGQYVVVNQTLVERCGLHEKREILGKQVHEVFPLSLARSYRDQDEEVLRSGNPISNQLELHFYSSGGRGWCLTNKLPLRDREGRVVGLVGASKDIHPPNERTEDYSQVAKVIQQIQTRYAEPLRVRDLAAQAGLSEYQFEQRIKRILQLTPGQLIQKVRMEVAIRRLRETDDSIARIALDCGYGDQSAFTRQFRQTTGVSPSEYRRSLRRKPG